MYRGLEFSVSIRDLSGKTSASSPVAKFSDDSTSNLGGGDHGDHVFVKLGGKLFPMLLGSRLLAKEYMVVGFIIF